MSELRGPRVPFGPLAVTLMLLIGALVAAGSSSGAAAGIVSPDGSSGAHTAPPASPAVETRYAHPVVAGMVPGTGPAARPDAQPSNGVPWSCSPAGNSTIFPEIGVNFTVSTTPGNGSGPAPVNFTWNITVGGGGLPPFHAWVYAYTASVGLNSFNVTGNFTFGQAGTWEIQILVEDATCTQEGAADLTVMAWNATLGPNPVAVTVTPSVATAPANVTYTFAAPSVPAGWSIYWVGLGFYPYTAVENHTYYLPGTYNETACLVEPDGTDYACGTSDNVSVLGASAIQYGVTVTAGPYPENVTFWSNITNASVFPNGTSTYIYAWNGTSGNSVQTTNASANLTESVGCGFPWTHWAVPLGMCEEIGWVVLTAPAGSPDDGDIAVLEISTNLTANGSPVNWWPSVSYTYGPSNGSAPLNVSINVSASYGLAPYTLTWTVAGDSGNGTGSVLYNVTFGTLYPWNGTLTTLTIPLTLQGYYWVGLEVEAANYGYAYFALPLVVVGNATIPPFVPLQITASETNSNGSATGNTSIGQSLEFVAIPSGGDGPYNVQWSFGDGQFASSLPGDAVSHSYASAGTYVPTVTVTDARGVQVTSTLPTVTVVAGTSGGPGGLGSGGHGNGSGQGTFPVQVVGPGSSSTASWVFPAAVIVAAAFMMAGLLLSRREVGREGEALVAGLETDDRGSPAGRRP
jgi:hypothetical protein